ncbi:cadherin-23 [Plakobranchus ocellatus]|uniref:Cadherin-23 n=1 Tax=Plakobranchus ocellatus TaxID=259542 RepID=A0AAV4BYY3_9GAST|nr:cadherin-23 [Plakobranchus ocellatus]
MFHRFIVQVFVTSPSNVVKLKVNRALTDVQPFSEQLVNTLEGTSNADIAFACIDNMRNHIDDDGDEVLTATDVFVTAVRRSGSNYEIYPADALVTMINDDRKDDDSPFNAIYITEVEYGVILPPDVWIGITIYSDFFTIWDRKKKRKIQAARHSIVQPVVQPVETSFNPVYDNRGDQQEAVYTTVKKLKPAPAPITPVVIQAPQKLEPLASEPPRNLKPVEPVDPVPVIETEILPEKPVSSSKNFQPEFENRIETVVVDEPPPLPSPPPEVADIEVIINDEVDTRASHSPGNHGATVSVTTINTGGN